MKSLISIEENESLLLIKEFAFLIGVIVDTVINREILVMRPWRKTVKETVEILIKN